MIYRADIDGLRAIAILFVLFFHGGLSLFPSGFIGVDIFFVISGFLITSLIEEGLQNNHFSFAAFYNRRLWRLQPVFLCLLLVTFLITLIYYLPEDLLLFSKSLRKSALFLSNQYFAKVTTGYFAFDAHQLPLLNTWSLAIEWQCYLILPIVIYFLHKHLKKYRSYILYTLTLGALFLALYLSHQYPDKTYYQWTSRMFEFLMGASLVFLPGLGIPRFGLELINLTALTLLLYIATKAHVQDGFPNGFAFMVCLATAALIFLGRDSNKTWVSRLLCSKIFVGIGLISYSLYIWHWPLFALIRYQSLPETPGFLCAIFTLVFILGYLSWRFIEKPTRKYHHLPIQYTVLFLFFLPVAFTQINDHLIKKNEGYPARFQKVDWVYKKLKASTALMRASCLEQENTPVNTLCRLGASHSASKKAFMIGDSFSNHFWGFMDVLGKEADIAILAHATIACLTLPGIYQYDWYAHNAVYQQCYEQTKRYFDMIKENHYDYVILGQNWNGYLGNKIINQLNDKRSLKQTQKRIAQALDTAIQRIVESGAKPVLLHPSAYIDANLHDCFFKHFRRRTAYKAEECNFKLAHSETVWLTNLFKMMKNKYAQLIIIDPKKAQCVQGICRAAIKGVPVFRDREHITDFASYAFAKVYLKHYINPFHQA